MTTRNPKGETSVVTQKKTALKTKKPNLYKVLLHNDDFTTMEFVVAVLQSIFHHSETDATAIMLHIHQRGIGVAGVYPFQIAEAKVGEVTHAAEKAEFPLLSTLEPDENREDDDDK
ncbi:MAG TPA: ATP-dependent Clp protease adaptor ClpS [Haliangiales bacterium]|nr:ATP-dependent Clp protease adaptor ClpS [Haliangiales bacterium]